MDFLPATRTGTTFTLNDPENLLRYVGDRQERSDAHASIPSSRLLGFSLHQKKREGNEQDNNGVFPSSISFPHTQVQCAATQNCIMLSLYTERFEFLANGKGWDTQS
jgi:hypothetical protein